MLRKSQEGNKGSKGKRENHKKLEDQCKKSNVQLIGVPDKEQQRQ